MYTLELVELLQQSAVEHLTTYRQLEAERFGSVATIVTTDFEALYIRVQTWRLSTLFIYSCQHGTFARYFMLFTCRLFRHLRTLFSCAMMTHCLTDRTDINCQSAVYIRQPLLHISACSVAASNG